MGSSSSPSTSIRGFMLSDPGAPHEAVVSPETKPADLPARLPSLDGWRALSICLVLGEHSLFTFDCPRTPGKFIYRYFDGDLGVRFFFVISGFLITYLLLK